MNELWHKMPLPAPRPAHQKRAWTHRTTLVWTTPSPTTTPSRAWRTLLQLLIALSMLPSKEWDRGQSFLIMDGFLKCIPMQSVGRGHLKPSYWREVNISPVLDPAIGRVEWDGGEKGWSHTSPYCWITGDGKAAGFRGRLIACLCSSDSCKQWLKLFPQAQGTCPAEGHCILCLGAWGEVGGCPSCCCTHTHKCAHTQHTKGFWKARPGSQPVSLHCHPE